MIIKIFQHISKVKCYYLIKLTANKIFIFSFWCPQNIAKCRRKKKGRGFVCSLLKELAHISFFIKLYAFQNQGLLGIYSKSTPVLPFCLSKQQQTTKNPNSTAIMTTLPWCQKNCFKFSSKCCKLICYPLFTEAEVTELSLQIALINVIPLGLNIPELFSLYWSFSCNPFDKD